jgi:hypothetical protein
LFALKESDMADNLIDLDKLFKREPPKLLHRQCHYDPDLRRMQGCSRPVFSKTVRGGLVLHRAGDVAGRPPLPPHHLVQLRRDAGRG